MKLTKLIFDYWKVWMSIPDEENIWVNEVLDEGFTYCDGCFVSFWWILNKEWYKMNDKMCSRIDSTQPYFDPLDTGSYYETH